MFNWMTGLDIFILIINFSKIQIHDLLNFFKMLNKSLKEKFKSYSKLQMIA